MPKTLHPCPFCRSQLPDGTYYCLHCRSQLNGRPVESFEGAFLGPLRAVLPVTLKDSIINYREDLNLSAWWCHRLAKVLYVAGSVAFVLLVTALLYPDYELHTRITRPLGFEPGFLWIASRSPSKGAAAELFGGLFAAVILWIFVAFVIRLVYYQLFLYIVFGSTATVSDSLPAPVQYFSSSHQTQLPSESTLTASDGVQLGRRNSYASWALGVGVVTIFLWQFSVFPLITIGLSIAGINHAPKVGNNGRARAWISLTLGVLFLLVYVAQTVRGR
jgi:hypothetical protein